MKNFKLSVLALALVASLASCGGGDISAPTPSTGTTPVVTPVQPAAPQLNTVIPAQGTENLAVGTTMVGPAPLGGDKGRVDADCYRALVLAGGIVSVKLEKYNKVYVAYVMETPKLGVRVQCKNAGQVVMPYVLNGKVQ